MEVWSTRIPSDGLTLSVRHPTNLQVDATANHSQKLDPLLSQPNIHKWKLDHGMFPFQSVVFWWKPINEDGVQKKSI